MEKILGEYGGRVRVVIKHYPYKYRDFSFISAQAALAARDQGKFEEMHWLLHERSPKLDRESLLMYARELELDEDRFTRDLEGQRLKGEIDEDLKLARELDLYSTPAFYINGIKLVGNRPFESFQEVIDRELASAGTGEKKE